MLTRLFSYEIKATARLFLPVYLALLIFAGINRIFSLIHSDPIRESLFTNITAGISMTVYVTLMVGILVMTLVVLIQRFYKNLLGNEGYLMFTLPVQTWKHIINKLAISMMWVILSGIVAIISIFIIIPYDDSVIEFYRQISRGFSEMIHYFGNATYLIGLESIILGILALASSILMIYSAIALGHLFNKHKLLASFGMYIVLSAISKTIMGIYMLFIDGIIEFISFTTFSNIQLLLLFIFIYLIAITVGYFILTQFILKNKLNLE